jgi:hypothetical protein
LAIDCWVSECGEKSGKRLKNKRVIKTFSGLAARVFNLTDGSFVERKRSKVFSGKN